jgi:5S rRNA maturation endonuclease (ribonuclease M5)
MRVHELAARLEAKCNGHGWQAKCPAHEDHTPSLSISEGHDGRILLKCFAGCPTESIVAALGLELRDLFVDNGTNEPAVTYDYVDESGTLLFQVCRFIPKAFKQRRPDGTGWAWKLDGVRRVLYRLPQLRAAVAAGKRVFVVEGEKDVHALEALGKVATTNPSGAGKWRPEYSEMLKGADVVIVADKDDPGRTHARDVAKALRGSAAKVVVVEPAVGKDVSDHVAAGRKLGELVPVTLTAPETTDHRTPWEHAQSAPDFLAVVEEELDFLEDRILARGAITEWFSPRGLGKTHAGHAIAVKLARGGRRVLLLDRDNSPREVRRRLKGWAAATTPTLHVLTRDQAPPLTDTTAWASFPVDTYDVVVVDSLDATTEGVGEQDSSRPSRALATLLDIARRPNGPAVLTLGNTVKSAAHSRGSGVVEDRADIVYEVRDATDLRPTGTKPWWEELPKAGAEAWAERASRRKRRDTYRLAMVPTKFRVGEEPDPFVLEIDLGGEPWTLREVTDELARTGEQALAAAAEATQAQLDEAARVLRDHVEAGDQPNRETAQKILMGEGLTLHAARDLIKVREGTDWRTVELKEQKGKPRVLMPTGESTTALTEIPPRDNPDGTRANEGDSRQASDTKARRECPEITLTPQGVPRVGISVSPVSLPRTCPKGHAMEPLGSGWICYVCYPAARPEAAA